ncbi:fructosamine kinase family protein [Actinotalea sp. Marseille-Q4924]|uniref:fructosamine kinase family protein n=1 Tax=Actinotalea sp. Marseille-Q4924 TaxID=2866571 RepID=UPI001CE4899F
MTTYVKQRRGAPPGFFACEAAGLRWLAVPGGARVVEVRGVSEDGLQLERLTPQRPTPAVAEAFGHALVPTHAAGAPAFGAPAAGWTGDGFFGPLDDPRPLPAGDEPTWGAFYARCRVRAVRDQLAAADALPARLALLLERLAIRLESGAFNDDTPPARVHGDLWSGNVVWTAGGAVLVDPAAHGGHALTDLAMLDLFGLPHLERVLAAYAEAAGGTLPDGWRDLLGLHQVHPVGMHAVLFGGGYGRQLEALVERYA